ncbi:hypothetical protein OGAPHI_007259 [Ogataea philodendri]|uniref:Uncharacterized protein n=1 Tax=Ogataea philodendri TaxID=1378263 RepID=A0A9P8NV92_9ASCO|nr:uncharacterized protein OGAPHI_007259 [Ogataea philodendri]KAH3660054.1 hypothetical protein OGAPHI_007259 [Ogataea philodendri]
MLYGPGLLQTVSDAPFKLRPDLGCVLSNNGRVCRMVEHGNFVLGRANKHISVVQDSNTDGIGADIDSHEPVGDKRHEFTVQINFLVQGVLT